MSESQERESALPKRLDDLDRQIVGEVRKLVEDVQREISGRLRQGSLDMLRLVEEITPRLPESFRDRLASLEPEPQQNAGAGVGAVLEALGRLDLETSQASLLNALLDESRRFASRVAFFLTRPGEARYWSSQGFGRAAQGLEALDIDYADGDAWARLAHGRGVVRFDESERQSFAERLATTPPSDAVLVPFVLRGQLAGALYADRSEGDVDLGSLQIVVYAASQALETLSVRAGVGSPTLRSDADGGEGVPLWQAEGATAVPHPSRQGDQAASAADEKHAERRSEKSEVEPSADFDADDSGESLSTAEDAGDAAEPSDAAPSYEETYQEASYEAADDAADEEGDADTDAASSSGAALEAESDQAPADGPWAQREEREEPPAFEPAEPPTFEQEGTGAAREEAAQRPEASTEAVAFETAPELDEETSGLESVEPPELDTAEDEDLFAAESEADIFATAEDDTAEDEAAEDETEPSLEELAEPALEGDDLWELEEDESTSLAMEEDEDDRFGTTAPAATTESGSAAGEKPSPTAPEIPAVGQQTVRLDVSSIRSQGLATPPAPPYEPPTAASEEAPAEDDVFADYELEPEPEVGAEDHAVERDSEVHTAPLPTIPATTPATVPAPPRAGETGTAAEDATVLVSRDDIGFGSSAPAASASTTQAVDLPQPAPPTIPPAAPAAPPVEERGGSSEVRPPDDVQGPGLAFRRQEQAIDSSVPEGEAALHEEARRLARLLVSEIKLYNEELIEVGRRDGNIYERLREDIDRSRQMYAERIDPRVKASDQDYFQQEMVQRLAGGDASVLGT